MPDDITRRPEDVDTDVETGASVPARTDHWTSRRDADGIETLVLDRRDANANTLGRAVLLELEAVVERLEADPPKGLIVTSGKPDHFVYGGDIGEFGDYDDPEEVTELIRRVHRTFDRLEGLSCPTVALLRGACLGGGLELALACDCRVAEAGTKLGFPEIMIGIHPGFGGTVRATRLLPAPEAMELMLTGRTIDARRARRMGLVDDVQPDRHLEAAARAALARGCKRRHSKAKTWLMNSLPVRAYAAREMREKTEKKAPKRHYPAPHALIDLWRAHGGDRDGMMAAEARSVGRLIVGETARNLIRVFHLRERLKGEVRRPGRPVERVHVVGAGVMGGDIAAWCALQGLRVTLSDLDTEQIGRAIGRAHALFRKRLRDGAKIRDAHDRLIPDPAGDGLRRADLVIEAVAEKLDVKRKVFADVVARAPAGAVLATNTSSIPLEDIAETLDDPRRLIGLHFFNPVAKLPLVEVVSSAHSTAAAAEAGAAFVDAIGKLPLPVRSAPGFLVNRALMPYMLEAVHALAEGISAPTIDKAAEDFGMPVGPVELADQVGLDIALEVGRSVGGPGAGPPEVLERLVEKGHLGRKTGQGFYRWRDGKPEKTEPDRPPDGFTDRLILPMLDAYAALVREGIVADADLADAGAVFGTGFAPFRGGPLHYARARGQGDVAARLAELAKAHGERFAPDGYWSGHGTQ